MSSTCQLWWFILHVYLVQSDRCWMVGMDAVWFVLSQMDWLPSLWYWWSLNYFRILKEGNADQSSLSSWWSVCLVLRVLSIYITPDNAETCEIDSKLSQSRYVHILPCWIERIWRECCKCSKCCSRDFGMLSWLPPEWLLVSERASHIHLSKCLPGGEEFFHRHKSGYLGCRYFCRRTDIWW